MKNSLLSVQDLRVHFIGDETVALALDGVSYDVREGETVCIVGESGCGKTVSALSILGLIPQPPGKIKGGKIFFNGRNLLDLDEDEMQRIRGNQISMVFQEPMTSLNPVFTIEDQLQEAMIIHEELDVAERHQRSVQLLRDVGIAGARGRG
jgi:ABC-type dipeptide/oligopeptide/nickel transport system ATPase component